MWSIFFEAVDRVTGRLVAFDPFSSQARGGLRAIVVDGCQAQIEGLGDFLVKRNQAEISGISETDPLKIVQYIVKICNVHFERSVSPISLVSLTHRY